LSTTIARNPQNDSHVAMCKKGSNYVMQTMFQTYPTQATLHQA